MSKEFRDERKLKKHIEVLRDDFEWYIKTHELADDTGRTGFSGLMAMLLHSYRTVCENPKEFASHMLAIAQVDLTNRSGELVKEELDVRKEIDKEIRGRTDSQQG